MYNTIDLINIKILEENGIQSFIFNSNHY